MADFPTTLPRPLSSEYALAPVSQVVKTEMEGGSTRVRRRTTARIDKVSVVYNFTSAEMTVFRGWFDDVNGANGGASWFNTSLVLGDGGYISVEARFNDVWSATYAPMGRWQVSATLEVRYA